MSASKPPGSSSLSGTGAGPSPKTPIARTTPPAGRRASMRNSRGPNGATPSPSPLSARASSALGGSVDGDLIKMTKDQLISLLQSERKTLEETQQSRSELEESLAKAQESLEAKDEQVGVLKGKLEDREKEFGRVEEEFGRYVEEKETWEAQAKELEKLKAQARDSEKKSREQTDSYEADRAAWTKQEEQLKLRLSSLRKEMPSPRRPAVADLPPVQAPDSTPDPDPATENIESPVPEAASPSEATTTSPVVTILEAQVETTDEPEEEINFRRSPSFRAPRLHGGLLPHAPSSSSSSPTQRNATPPAGGSNTLPGVPLPPEMMAEWADLRSQHSSLLTSHSSLQSNLTQLRTEMTDLQRVNAQLMEENESYELLVGEKTLKGELDLKALLRRSYSSDTEGDGGSDDGEGLRSFSTTGTSVGSGARLEEVKEEDEDNLSDGDGTPNPNTSASGIDDDVEKMILETQGSGSRSTGAVEAETTSAKKKKLPPRAGQKTTQPMGLGLDLAAELEKAEEGEQATKEVEEKKALRRQQARQGSASTPGGEVAALRAEIKSLKDANKALSLYISKIIDRIVAMDGFEKVLSADYKSASPPATQSAFGAAALKGSRSESKATSVSVAPAASLKSPVPVEPKQPVKRMSLGTWTLSPTALFGGVGSSKSAPPVPPAGMKPLRLVNPSTPREASPPVGTPSVGTPSVGTEGEDEEDAKERERLRAEMKLHGIEKTTTAPRLDAPLPPAPAGIEQTLDAGSDAASLKTSTSSRASRRTSGFYAPSPQIPFTSYSTGDSPPLGPGSASTTVTGATVLKREEDREREIRANLEKGNAGGFTEIRGHRRRPSNPRSGSSTPSMISISRGTPEPDAGRRSVSPMIMSPSLDGPQAPTPTAATAPSAVPAVTSPSLEAGETPESMFSRAARRISFNWAAKAPEVPPKTDEA